MHRTIQSTVKRLAHHFGFVIYRIPTSSDSSVVHEHTQVLPRATYSPWNKDVLFQQAYALVQDYTMVDQYRCYELWKLIEQSAKLNMGSIIEIGVWRGGTGALMARQAKTMGMDATVFLCDTFKGVVKAGLKDTTYQGGEHDDTTRNLVEKLIFKQMELDNVEILEGIFPEESSHQIQEQKFRLCHIDVDVYQSAKDILDWIWDRLIPGGIIVYDDYGFKGCGGITTHVEEQVNLQDRLVFHNLNGHAIILKI